MPWCCFWTSPASAWAKRPTALSLTDIEPDLILAFLDHLEQERHNTAQTRNLRLVALRAFLKFAARRDVAALQSIEQALGRPYETLRATHARVSDARGDVGGDR